MPCKTKGHQELVDFIESKFANQIASEDVKLHQRMQAYPTAGAYNRDYGQTANRIETKSGYTLSLFPVMYADLEIKGETIRKMKRCYCEG